MKVLITGGLGFIGVNTAIEFYKEGYEITKKLLTKIPEDQKPRILKNLDYLKDKLK